ncbi:hypothetical protein P4S63_02760 [Pseudoalteromonas sp. B193]
MLIIQMLFKHCKAVRSGDYKDYSAYADLVNNRPIATLRDMLALKLPEQGISIDEVESAETYTSVLTQQQ